LPWDQFGYWARKVEVGIVGMAPGAGQFLQEMIQGGPQLGSLGLTRAYAVHVAVLPAAMLLLLWLRHALAKKQGWAPVAAGAASAPYYRQLSRNIVGGILLLAAVFYMAWRAHGAPLDAPADPTSNYPARPEWFLLPMFQLRKYFHGAGEFYGTSLIPAAAGLYLFALPLLDKKPGASLRARIGPLVPAALVGLGAALLSMAALRKDAGDAKYQKEHQQAEARAAYALELAKAGIPTQGPVYMMHNDPELRGHDLFEKSCASCHVLGDLGDKKKANATLLDGWGTEDWIAKMIHDPDADDHFGKTPYKGEMPPVDTPTKDNPKPMLKGPDEVKAAALFLAIQGDEAGESPRKVDEAARKKGESIVTEQCTSCHLWKGSGDDEGNGKAPEFFHYGSIAWVRTQVANPSSKETYREDALDEKLKGHMPRFDGDLSPADVELVARWTRAHARGVPLTSPKADATGPSATAHAGSAASTPPGAPSGSSGGRKNKGKDKDKE
jgi:ubiquinol-cytochrome c reductase cytochrome b subunit